MPTGRSAFWIQAGPEFKRVAVTLRSVDRALPGELRKRLKDGVQPLVREAKAKVLGLPVQGHAGSTGLRRRVARGVGVKAGVSRSGSFRVTTSMANPDEVAIPRGLDSPRGWRHPVFGNRDNWVTQRALEPGWFTETMVSGRDDIEQSLTDALEWARDTIASAGGPPRPGV